MHTYIIAKRQVGAEAFLEILLKHFNNTLHEMQLSVKQFTRLLNNFYFTFSRISKFKKPVKLSFAIKNSSFFTILVF